MNSLLTVANFLIQTIGKDNPSGDGIKVFDCGSENAVDQFTDAAFYFGATKTGSRGRSPHQKAIRGYRCG
jgi:hypothetical protein